MKTKFRAKPTPHLLIDNVFSDKQLEDICREIYVLHPAMMDEQHTGAAGTNHNPRKRNKGLFMHETYARTDISTIHRHMTEAMASSEVTYKWKPEWLRELYGSVLDMSVLLSRYDDGDCYLPHRDASVFTGLVWLWEDEKPFTGGEFTLTDYDYEVECKPNSGIIFLSHEYHAVAPVVGGGRYTISCFMGKPG